MSAREREKVEAFVDRCALCHHRSWDVGDSGIPIFATCKHADHESLGAGWPSVDCGRVAERYQEGKCPKFWPVILRAPWRLLWRGVARRLRRV